MKFSIKTLASVQTFVLALLVMPVIVAAQESNSERQTAQASLTGKYEATVKDSTGESKVTLDLAESSGKYTGAITTSRGVFEISKAQLVDGTLTLESEATGLRHKLSVRQKDDSLVGTLWEAGKATNIELRRVKLDEISGEWDAVADASGQPFPFALTLKLDGEKVTGSSVSQLGNSNISEGSWKDGKLAVILEGGSGKIALAATMIDGKLSGDYDYAGQLQGKWVAIRKK